MPHPSHLLSFERRETPIVSVREINAFNISRLTDYTGIYVVFLSSSMRILEFSLQLGLKWFHSNYLSP